MNYSLKGVSVSKKPRTNWFDFKDNIFPTVERMKNHSERYLEVNNLSFYYGKIHAIKGLTIKIKENQIVAIVGPAGSGKTTFLRCFNRIYELYPKCRCQGEIVFRGDNILDPLFDPIELRSRIGMVFQKPTCFPMSIFGNISYALSLKGIRNNTEVKDRVEAVLHQVGLWSEVSDKLKKSALDLTGGQQQRLVIARALAVEPEMMLLDEATNSLDPSSTSKIEELVFELKENLTVLFVTQNMQQAARISDETAFLYKGELIEFDETNTIFTNPKQALTEDYVTGRFG